MKALPKRKGNTPGTAHQLHLTTASMKALPKRKGNYFEPGFFRFVFSASMKALPKRKGNTDQFDLNPSLKCLNESPSEKEGKCRTPGAEPLIAERASMKALPKRKGNAEEFFGDKLKGFAPQ